MRQFDTSGQHGSMYQNNYTKEQNQQFAVAFAAITDGFKQLQVLGASASDPEVQDLVRQHYEFCLQFWTPSRAAYKSLAQSYLLPSPYRDSYEAVYPGLAKYHYDAIVIWADQNLK